MKKIYFSIILLSTLFIHTHLFSQDSIPPRPKIGLVLSGGGAKGMAHIGVLKVLEKHNIPIDYITGTSMGSIIGGLYAIGYSPEDLEKLAKNIDWNEIFSGSIKRSDISVEEKSEADKYILEFPYENGKFVLPKGMISGQKLEKLLARITWPAHSQNDFLKFKIPFACVATDIETGEAYVMNKGFLADALRASMSIPSVFAPIEINGHLLVDGGLVRNLPASDAKKMGTDIIIGVNVGSPLYKKEELTSMLAIMDQAASFRNAFLLKDEINLCDILISPDITGFSAASFDATDTLIERGEKAALEIEDQIIALSEKLKKYGIIKNKSTNTDTTYSIFISDIEIEGLNKVSKKIIISRLNIKPNTNTTLEEIEKGIDKIYGTQFFNKVNYRIKENENRKILVIRVSEKPFSIIKVGANYNYYFNASLLLNGSFRNLLGEGSKLIIEGKLSEAPEVSVDYSIFTKFKPSIGFRTRAEYFTLEEKIYFPKDSLNLRFRHHNFTGKVAAVSSLSNFVYIAAGMEYIYHYFDIVELEQENFNLNYEYLKLFGELYIDSYDRTVFPTKGIQIKLKADYLITPFDNDEEYSDKYWRFSANLNRYIPLSKKFNINYMLNSTLIFADNVFIGDYYRLGGEMDYKSYVIPFSGLKFMEISALNILTARIGFRYEIFKNKYLMANADGGFYSEKIDRLIIADEFLFGWTIGIGTNTLIGPLEFKVGKNNRNNNWNFWIKLGYSF